LIQSVFQGDVRVEARAGNDHHVGGHRLQFCVGVFLQPHFKEDAFDIVSLIVRFAQRDK
jgi:hypothetical protein